MVHDKEPLDTEESSMVEQAKRSQELPEPNQKNQRNVFGKSVASQNARVAEVQMSQSHVSTLVQYDG